MINGLDRMNRIRRSDVCVCVYMQIFILSLSALALVVLFSFAFEMDTFVHGLGRICTLLSPMFMMAILFFSSRCVCERERERITQAMLYIDMRTLIEQSEREREES